jgi:hypothetical protein
VFEGLLVVCVGQLGVAGYVPVVEQVHDAGRATRSQEGDG